MPTLRQPSRSGTTRLGTTSLFATTSIAALLLAAPAKAGQTITNQTVATVTNPAGNATTSIVITGSTVTGAVTNAGTITAGKLVVMGRSATIALAVLQSTVGGGIANSGTITATSANTAEAMAIIGSSVSGGIANNGTINTNGISHASGIFVSQSALNGLVSQSTVTGGIANNGIIASGTSGVNNATGIVVAGSITGGISNSGTINAKGELDARGIIVFSNGTGLASQSTINGGITNIGTIIAASPPAARGIALSSVSIIGSGPAGGISNSGTINVSAGFAGGIGVRNSTVSGGISNKGMINVSGTSRATGIGVANSTISGGIANNGTIIVTSPQVDAFGIVMSNTSFISSDPAGDFSNSGTIIASGVTRGDAVSITLSQLPGGITNTGTIFGSTNSITIASTSASTTITQSAGALIGGVTGAGIDVLNVTGGALSLQPTSTVTGLATLNQSGGNVVLQVTPSNAAGQFPTVNVGALTLSGVLEVAPQSGVFAAGAANAITYANVFTASTLNNGITQVQVFDFFSTGVTASLTGGNVTLTNNSGMALTPGVASGAGSFTTLTNPIGAILPAVSVTNGASVTGGIVNQGFIGVPGLPGSTGIFISNGSLSGPIVNTGTIAGTVSAIDVTGANGATTIMQSTGTITGAIKLSAHADTLTINGGAIVGDIVGAGTSDTVNIDPVNNANGIFTYANAISGIGAINIAANGNLALTAQGVLNNNMGLLTLTPTSRISGTGTFTQGTAGTTALQFTNNTASGAFPTIAANAITLAGKLQVVLKGAFPASGMEDFVKVFAASGTLTNNIGVGNVSVVTSGATLPAGTTVTAQLVQSGNSADVVVTEGAASATPNGGGHVDFAAVSGLTSNEVSVANALNAVLIADTKASQPLLMALLHLNGAGLTQAFDALSGEVHAGTVTAAFGDALLPNTAILDRLNQPIGAPLLGVASTMTGAYAADLPSGKGPRVAPVAVQMYQPRMFDFWGQGFGDWGHVSSDGNAAALSRSTGGFVLGGDVTATNFMGGDWRLGVAGGYTNDRITASQRLSSATFESVFGGVYAGASFGAVQLRAGALYGTNSTSTTRSVIFPGFADATSSSNGGSTAQAFGEAGYRITLSGTSLGGLAFQRASVEPFVGAAAIRIHQNGFTEGGGIAALTGTAKDFDIQTTTLGVRSELAFANMPVTFTSMLAWRHAFGNVVPSTLLAFQGGAQSFSVSGIPIDRDALVAETGVNYAVTPTFTVGLSYSSQLGQRAFDNAFKGHLNLSF